MSLTFGLDIGTTSIGFAAVDLDLEKDEGNIRRLGVRIFPEARDPKNTPFNQKRRGARLHRRQLRRRRERRRLLGQLLCDAGLLPAYNSHEWDDTMKNDPYTLRKQAFEDKPLSPYEIGRAIYHLAKRRHFKGRDIDEISDGSESDDKKQDDTDEKKAKTNREETLKALKQDGRTLGAWLAARGPHERKRGAHAIRKVVEDEFDSVWAPLVPEGSRESVRDAIFYQRPVFWRKKHARNVLFRPWCRPVSEGCLAVTTKANAGETEQPLVCRRQSAPIGQRRTLRNSCTIADAGIDELGWRQSRTQTSLQITQRARCGKAPEIQFGGRR